MMYVVIEYPLPTSPANRRVLDIEGPVIFDATEIEAREYFERLGGAPSPFRVVPIEYAVKNGLMPGAK